MISNGVKNCVDEIPFQRFPAFFHASYLGCGLGVFSVETVKVVFQDNLGTNRKVSFVMR